MIQLPPLPPTDSEKKKYLNQNKLLVYIFGLFSYVCLILGMSFFSLKFGFFWPFTLLVAFYLGISYFLGIFSLPFRYLDHRLLRWKNRDYRPTVDVYLPSCGEETSIIQNTFKYVSGLNWPRDKLRVYVLDDRGVPEIKAMAESFGFSYMCRPDRGHMKKAGNLRYAFPQTNGELIVIFDADFAPRSDFLTETVPYFKHVEEKVAIVQTPQYFTVEEEQTWVEKGAGYIQELFYRLVQVNRDYWGAAICVGTNAVYRRSALEPFGGTALIDYSEDVHTGFNVMCAGWKVKYIPVNLAKGVCPNTMSSYFTQQYRWCMGSITLCTNLKFWQSPLTIMQKLNFLSGMSYYVATGVGVFATYIPSMVMVWVSPENVHWFNWTFSVPSFVFGFIYMACWNKAPFGWYAPKTRVVAYYAHLFAMIDKIKSDKMPWLASGSQTKKNMRYEKFKNVSFWWVCVYAFVSISGCFYNMDSLFDKDFYPMIFFTILNSYITLSIFKDEA